jgi:hypothetical protein
MRELTYVRGRDADFAAAMRKAEAASEPKPGPQHPLDIIGRTRAGIVIRRNGERFSPGPFFDLESVPLVN